MYVAIFAVDLRSDVQGIYVDSDIASAVSIGQSYAGAGHGAVVTLGNILWFPALFFERATVDLPAHREIWEGAPYVISLIGIGLVAWTARAASGQWAAVMVFAALAVASPILIGLQFGWSVHALTYVLVAALGCFQVACAGRDDWIGGPVGHGALVLGLAALTAIGLASDELFLVAGVLPFALTAALLLWLTDGRGRRAGISAAAVVVLGAVGAVVLRHAVVDDRIVPATFPVRFAADDQLLEHLGLLVESGFSLFSGLFEGGRAGAFEVLELACALVVLAAMVVAIVAACRSAATLWTRPRSLSAMGGARLATLCFWGLVSVLTSFAYLVTNVAVSGTERYLVPAAYGVVTVMVVLGDRDLRRRAAVVLGVGLITLTAVVESARHELSPANSREPTAADARVLGRVLAGEGLRYGYAGYWTAAPLTWFMNGTASIYPVYDCNTSQLCPFYLHTISSWYTPRSRTRTFLVEDPTQPLNPTAPAGLGAPAQTLHVAHFTIEVFDYDIASRFA